jgi:outer membrane protein
MKNGLLVWNVLLTLIAGYLLIAHFRGSKNVTSTIRSGKTDTTNNSSSFRIAYFEMDSVEANFSVVKEVKAELSRRESTINVELDRMGKNLQQRYNYFQNQAQSGALSQSQSDAASQELKTLDEDMKNRKLVLDQEYSDYVTRSMRDVKTKIEEFLKEYNKTRGYSYIVSYEQGLFYYKDSTYNITSDVIKGLNEMYKAKKN